MNQQETILDFYKSLTRGDLYKDINVQHTYVFISLQVMRYEEKKYVVVERRIGSPSKRIINFDMTDLCQEPNNGRMRKI